MRLRTDLALAALVGCLPLVGCSTTYRAESIEAWVVDAGTAQPLEGVAVAAHWELEVGEIFNNAPAGQVMVMETVTDQKGRMYFPAWGPKTTQPTFRVLGTPHLEHRDPQLLLFKPGYRWLDLANYPSSTYANDSLRKSEWNGKTIKLARFAGDDTGYAWTLTQLSNSMGYAFRGEDCEWRQTPRILSLLFSETNALRARGVDTTAI